MNDNGPKTHVSAASRVFSTIELLGLIIGQLDVVDFYHIIPTHPAFLSTAGLFRGLRRKFFLERDPTVPYGILEVNPMFELILHDMGWHIGAITDDIGLEGEPNFQIYVRRHLESSLPSNQALHRLGRMLKAPHHMIVAHSTTWTEIWPQIRHDFEPRYSGRDDGPEDAGPKSVFLVIKRLLEFEAETRAKGYTLPVNEERTTIAVPEASGLAGLGSVTWRFCS